MRQALTESILLSLLGGAAGLGIAFAGTRLILHFAFPSLRGMAEIPIDASPSLPVLLFAFGISLIAGACVRHRSRMDGHTGRSDRSASRRQPLHCPHRLAPAEDTRGVPGRALACLALGVRTAHGRAAQTGESGFRIRSGSAHRREHKSAACRLSGRSNSRHCTGASRIRYRSVPGVSAVALCTVLAARRRTIGALASGWMGIRAPGPKEDNSCFMGSSDGRDTLSVIGNPILRGRGISEQDTAASRHVAVVNEAFARRFFKNEDPIGKHFGQHGLGSEREYEIVGIAKDARYLTFNLDQPIGPFFFLPGAQHDFPPKTRVG